MPAQTMLNAWPVNHYAAIVVGKKGVVAEYGEVERIFPLASITKILSSYAVLIAVQEGAVELDESAGPQGSTIRHLLAHTSGLPVDSREAKASPGERRIYSNAGIEVCAEHIEAAVGMSFPSYVAEAIFEPLQMGSVEFQGSPAYSASAHSRDLARFAAELLKPEILAQPLLAEAVTVQFPGRDGVLVGYGNKKPNDWGLGFEIRSQKDPHWTGRNNSPETFGHFGASGTFLWVDPAVNLACIALTDRPFSEGWAKTVWPEFSDQILAEFSSSPTV